MGVESVGGEVVVALLQVEMGLGYDEMDEAFQRADGAVAFEGFGVGGQLEGETNGTAVTPTSMGGERRRGSRGSGGGGGHGEKGRGKEEGALFSVGIGKTPKRQRAGRRGRMG